MEWILEKYRYWNIKEKLTSYKRICELIILLVCIALYMLLRYSKVPQIEYQFIKSYEIVNDIKINEKLEKIEKHEIPKPSTTPDIKTHQSSSDWAEVINADFLKNDMNTILNQLPNRSLVDIPKKTNLKESIHQLKLEDVDHSITVEQNEYLNNESNLNKLMPRIRVDPKNIGRSVSVNDLETNQANIGKKQLNPVRDPSSYATDKMIPESGILEIPLVSDEVLSDRPDISIIKDQLMEWMQKNPSEFNHVTKSFMGFEVENLTSKDVFRHKDRVFELYLLYKKNIKELVICLIEGDESIKLIDSGFKKQSNYLRIGNVMRKKDRTMFSFSTTQLPASDRVSSKFYQIFISWWNKASRQNKTK